MIYVNDLEFLLGIQMGIFRFAEKFQKDFTIEENLSLQYSSPHAMFLLNHRSQTFKESCFSMVKGKRKMMWPY